jgi:hypothetical protein
MQEEKAVNNKDIINFFINGKQLFQPDSIDFLNNSKLSEFLTDNIEIEKRKHNYNSHIYDNEVKQNLYNHLNKSKKNLNDEELYCKIQMLLNKLTNDNFNLVSEEIKTLPYITREHIYILAEKIVIKSISENFYSSMYAKLCSLLYPYFIIENDNKVYFRNILLIICQNLFDKLTDPEYYENLDSENKIISESLSNNNNIKITGLINFIAELLNANIININIVHKCYSVLLDNIKNNSIDLDTYEALHILINITKNKIKKEDNKLYEQIKLDIQELLKTHKFTKMAYKFKIQDILDLF